MSSSSADTPKWTIMELTKEQDRAYRSAVYSHKNILITGPAGTGKSFLLRKMIQEFQRQSKRVAVTSLTGISASLLPGGYTFHHWLGMKYIANLEEKSYSEILDTVYRSLSQHAKTRIRNTDVLIIDEISMMPYYMFGLLNDLSQKIRKNMLQPIGGLQVIAIGDFHQLPPVMKTVDRTAKYVFQHPYWDKVFPAEKGHVHMLSQIVRQKDDETFRNILADVRAGRLRLEYERILFSKIRPLKDIPETIPRLYAVKRDIDEMNLTRLAQIQGEARIFPAKITPKIAAMAGKIELPRDTLIVENLALKEGAFVMFNKNITIDKTNPLKQFIANGQCGTIVNLYDKETGYPVVEYTDHSGCTFHYVCRPETWEYPMYSVTQLPIMLAWNISIHKSQGSTLDRVAIDVGDSVFEYGQMYVALSRCRSLDGLTLIKFQPTRLKTDPLVKEFYVKLQEKIVKADSPPQTPVAKKRNKEDDLDSQDRMAISTDVTEPIDRIDLDTDDIVEEMEHRIAEKKYFSIFNRNKTKQ
jgi:ATP-dependent DNA helicase PIF1